LTAFCLSIKTQQPFELKAKQGIIKTNFKNLSNGLNPSGREIIANGSYSQNNNTLSKMPQLFHVVI